MQLKEVRATFGLTVNLGNYQSARLESEVTYLASEGESYEQVFAHALADVYVHVRAQAVALYAKRNQEVLEILNALPAEVQAQIKE